MSVVDVFETMEYGPAPESTGEASAWLQRHAAGFGHFIGGEPRAAGATMFETRNPASGEVLARLTQGDAAAVDAALAAARGAQPAWAALSGHARARHLYALARAVQKNARLLAVVETLDNGKPIRESRDIDVPLVARHFYHHAGWAQLLATEFPGYEPLGVAGQIIPWNFPLLMLAWKVAPALATGNTVVLKPAEYTSLSALLFAELCMQAGLPAGVLNIVTGDGRTGALLAGHAEVDKVAFTGSTEVGRRIREASAGSGKKLTLELGGKSPFVVFDDADLDSAVEGLVDAIWFNQGQVCCAGSRLLVQESVAERLHEKIAARMATLRVGDPLDKAIDIGAIVDPVQLESIRTLVARGVEEGATLVQDAGQCPATGCFYPPTLLRGVEPASTVAQEEIFGPVLVSMTFRTPQEAVALANNTRYGLAASVWTENVNLALDVAPQIKAGVVWVNCTNQFDAAAGFGGYRESGFGREGGREGLYEYLRPAFVRKLKPIPDAAPVHPPRPAAPAHEAGIDRTPKLYIGGRQVRPDSGYSLDVVSPEGVLLGQVGAGNRKDVRDAVEAAAGAGAWSRASGHARAQVLYYVGENLDARAREFAQRLRAMLGVTARKAAREVQASIERLFFYAAWADKYDGAAHSVPIRGMALAMHEPNGVMGLVCPDDAPLLGLISLLAPALAMGNRAVVVPAVRAPLAATDFYQVLDTSDVPGGAVNIVTGERDVLARCLAEHYEVDALWYHGSREGGEAVERAAAANLKRTWVNDGLARDWFDGEQGEGREFLRHATQVKNVWVPYGE